MKKYFLNIDGLKIKVLEQGLSSGNTVNLFLHGFPGSSNDWLGLVASSSANMRSIAIDMPGFGRSDKPKLFKYTVENYADILDKIIKALELRNINLVLHDFGGAWGLHWGILNLEQIASLTLIDTGPYIKSWHYIARLYRAPIIGEIFSKITYGKLLRRSIEGHNPKEFPDAFINTMTKEYDQGTSRAMLKLYRGMEPGEFSVRELKEAFAQIKIPMLIIWGEKDPYLPIELADHQKEIFPDATLLKIPDAGHWPFIDAPEQVNKVLIPFLQQHSQTTECDSLQAR